MRKMDDMNLEQKELWKSDLWVRVVDMDRIGYGVYMSKARFVC